MSSNPTINSLDKKLDTLTALIERDFDSNKEFKSDAIKRMDKLELKAESLKDKVTALDKITTERINTVEKVQAENSTILESVQAIKGQVMRITISGFFGIFSVVSVAGAFVAYFFKG